MHWSINIFLLLANASVTQMLRTSWKNVFYYILLIWSITDINKYVNTAMFNYCSGYFINFGNYFNFKNFTGLYAPCRTWRSCPIFSFLFLFSWVSKLSIFKENSSLVYLQEIIKRHTINRHLLKLVWDTLWELNSLVIFCNKQCLKRFFCKILLRPADKRKQIGYMPALGQLYLGTAGND